jgi:hypothetical protein
LQWNRIDLARNNIFTGQEKFSQEQKFILIKMALIQNKPQFIELFLENGFDLKSFLSKKETLEELFNLEIVSSKTIEIKNHLNLNLFLNYFTLILKIDSEKKTPLVQIIKKQYTSKEKNNKITFKCLENFLKNIFFEDFKPNFLPDNKIDLQIPWLPSQIKYPEMNLFFWSLLLNRIELAQLFWKIGEVKRNLFCFFKFYINFN